MTTAVSSSIPAYGEVWIADLNPVKGHEQKGVRPVLVVSVDALNREEGVKRTVVVPITSKGNHRPFRVAHKSREGGLAEPGWLLCDQIRSISTERLQARCGDISDETLAYVKDQLALLLDL